MVAEMRAIASGVGRNSERSNDALDNAFLWYATPKSRMCESVANAALLAEQFGLMEQRILRQVTEHAATAADLHASMSWHVNRPFSKMRRTITGKWGVDD